MPTGELRARPRHTQPQHSAGLQGKGGRRTRLVWARAGWEPHAAHRGEPAASKGDSARKGLGTALQGRAPARHPDPAPHPPSPHPTHRSQLLSHRVAHPLSVGTGSWEHRGGPVRPPPTEPLRAAHAAVRPEVSPGSQPPRAARCPRLPASTGTSERSRRLRAGDTPPPPPHTATCPARAALPRTPPR